MKHITKKQLSELSPSRVWEHFYEISQIPRESGNEAGIRKYLEDFADKQHLFRQTDDTGNILMRKKASSGREHIPGIILQGHMDMVCVKEPGSAHNFEKDPILLVKEGDWLTADGTTLGADNGIALAMILAFLEEEDAVHGPVEALFTISEETGLDGAFGLDISMLQGRRLINLDSEEEGVFYIGSAGGGEIIGSAMPEWEAFEQAEAASPESKKLTAWEVTFTNFAGGHSGGEIHQGRANAVKEAVRFLKEITRNHSIQLISLNGGTKRNVIPSHCSAQFVIPAGTEAYLSEKVEDHMKILSDEYSYTDPNAVIQLTPLDLPEKVISRRQTLDLINALYITPHGIERMSNAVPGIVETSNNLAAVKMSEENIWIDTSQRSSIESSRIDIANRTAAALETFGASTEEVNVYPGWSPNPNSSLPQQFSDIYEELFGKKPEVTAIHAGLECGVINSKAPDMESISFGPSMEEVHSTAERVNMPSVERLYTFLKAAAAKLEN